MLKARMKDAPGKPGKTMPLKVRRCGRSGGSPGFFRLRTVLSWCALCLLLSAHLSCSKKIVELEKWPFEAKGIRIAYAADEALNLYEGKPHTLFVCVYQMSDPNAFNDLRMDRVGLLKLLECDRFDESVSSTDHFVIHPGEEDRVIYDRAEDARFVGVVAGYYRLWPKHATRLLLVPVKVEESGRFIKKKTAVPAPLSVNLYFAPNEIQQILE